VPEKAVDHTPEIAQVASDELVHQIGLRPIYCAADLEVDCGIADRFGDRLKILPDGREELAAHLVVQRELGIESQFAAKSNRAAGGKENVRRAQDQLVDQDYPGAYAILHLGLL